MRGREEFVDAEFVYVCRVPNQCTYDDSCVALYHRKGEKSLVTSFHFVPR